MGTYENMDIGHVFIISHKLQMNNLFLHYDSLLFYTMSKLLFLFENLQCARFDVIHDLTLWEHTNFVMATMTMLSN
jgi:hypothetical protein